MLPRQQMLLQYLGNLPYMAFLEVWGLGVQGVGFSEWGGVQGLRSKLQVLHTFGVLEELLNLIISIRS